MLITDWTEGAGGSGIVSNWDEYKASTAWNSGGCSGSGTDYTATHAASSNTPTAPNWQTWDITNIYNDAVSAGQSILSLVISIGGSDWASYYSRDFTTDTTKRPKIDLVK